MIMDGGNSTSVVDKIWADLIPSIRVFLTSVVLFLSLALLIMFVVLMFLKVLRTLWPRPTAAVARSTGIELTNFAELPGETEELDEGAVTAAQTDAPQVRFRGSDDQTVRKQVDWASPARTDYTQVQPGTSNYAEMAAPSTPSQGRRSGPYTSTPITPRYPVNPPVMSPLNQHTEGYGSLVPPPSCGTTPTNSANNSPTQRLFTTYMPPETPMATPYLRSRAESTPNLVTADMAQTSSMAQQSGSFSLKKARFPDTFNGRSDFRDWLKQFEIVARWNGWNEEEMGSVLASSLRGSAQQVLRDLPADEVENYESLVQALSRRFQPKGREGLHKDELKSRKKRRDETVAEYGFALNQIATSAYPRMPPKDREEIVIDQFIDNLPTIDLQRHVKFGNPKTLDRAIALATEYDSFNGRIEGRKPDDRHDRQNRTERPVRAIEKKEDNEMLQVMRELVQGQKEMKQDIVRGQKEIAEAQKSLAHQMKAPSSSSSGPRQNRQDMACYNCGDKSHLIGQCPHPPRNGPPRPIGTRGTPPLDPSRQPPYQRYPQQQYNSRTPGQTNFTPRQSNPVSSQQAGN